MTLENMTCKGEKKVKGTWQEQWEWYACNCCDTVVFGKGISFDLACDLLASAQYHWRSTLVLLPVFVERTLRCLALPCTQQSGCVCFQLCRTYAAHMQCTEMWCRDADVTAPFASFVVSSLSVSELGEQCCPLWAAAAAPQFPRTLV